jgi:hypothetical protein
MKQVPTMLVLGFALTLCNLTGKLTNTGNSNGPGKTNSGEGITAEKAEPTAAQKAALAGGQEAKWDKQGMSWTVPPKWTRTMDETKEFAMRSPGSFDAANLIVNISSMTEDFPTDNSLKATYDDQKNRMKNGEVDQLRWLEIDGVKGVQFRESNPEKPDGIRRMQWIAYRKYAGQVQYVNVMLSTDGKDFPRHEDAMYGVLYSMKLVH